MPNYMRCVVELEGISKLDLYSDGFEFDFQRVIPQPSEFNVSGELERYMSNARYAWRKDKWGTGSKAFETKIRDENIIQFDTAWTVPVGIFVRLSEMYPGKTMTVWYAGEDAGCDTGILKFRDGLIVQDIELESNSDEACINYNLCYLDEEQLVKFENGKWGFKSLMEGNSDDDIE